MKELRLDLESIAGVIKGCLESHGAAHWCVGLVVINPNEDDDSIVLIAPGHEAQIKRVIARVMNHPPEFVGFDLAAPPMNAVKLRVIEGGKDDSENG